MDSEKSKLIIGGITLVRVFIHLVIMQPWDCFNMSKDKFNTEYFFLPLHKAQFFKGN